MLYEFSLASSFKPSQLLLNHCNIYKQSFDKHFKRRRKYFIFGKYIYKYSAIGLLCYLANPNISVKLCTKSNLITKKTVKETLELYYPQLCEKSDRCKYDYNTSFNYCQFNYSINELIVHWNNDHRFIFEEIAHILQEYEL